MLQGRIEREFHGFSIERFYKFLHFQFKTNNNLSQLKRGNCKDCHATLLPTGKHSIKKKRKQKKPSPLTEWPAWNSRSSLNAILSLTLLHRISRKLSWQRVNHSSLFPYYFSFGYIKYSHWALTQCLLQHSELSNVYLLKIGFHISLSVWRTCCVCTIFPIFKKATINWKQNKLPPLSLIVICYLIIDTRKTLLDKQSNADVEGQERRDFLLRDLICCLL